MKLFIAEENSTGKLYVVNAKSEEDAYVAFGVKIYGMDPKTIDTGNVDINLYPVKPTPGSSVAPLKPDEK